MKRCVRSILSVALLGAFAGGCLFSSEQDAVSGLQVNWLDTAFGVDKPPLFGWRMSSKRIGAAQRAYRLTVAADAAFTRVVWDSGRIESPLSAGIPYSGASFAPATRYWWRVEVEAENGARLVSDPSWFETGIGGDDGWERSKWIMPKACDAAKNHPAIALRKILQNAKPVANVKWYVTGLGVFEAYVNGRPVTNIGTDGAVTHDELKPGCTDAFTTKQYFAYDITHLFDTREGARNVLAAVVTKGWWSDAIVGNPRGNREAFRGQLVVRYTNGDVVRKGTDESWDAAFTGPVQNAEIHLGEVYDARVGTDWMRGGRLDEAWGKAVENTEFKGGIRALQGPPVRIRENDEQIPRDIYVYKDITAATSNQFGVVTKLRDYRDGQRIRLDEGETLIIDFGQNAAGWEDFLVTGTQGTQLTIRHAEMLNDGNGLKSRGNDGPEGAAYLSNLRRAYAGTKYTLSGNGVEHYHPAFSFYGFRYLSVTATARVEFLRFRQTVVSSVIPGSNTAYLSTSDESVNRLVKNCLWGQYSNYLSIPTDCPQRDERAGWTADTQVFSSAAAYNAVSYGFLSKFMGDLRDTQAANGEYISAAPRACYGRGYGRVGWSDAGIIIPYNMWKAYGDTTILRENFASMCKYIDRLAADAETPHVGYGDWLSLERNEKEYQKIIVAAYRVWDFRMMAEMATALREKVVAKNCSELAEKAVADFRAGYLKADGTVKDEYKAQTAFLFTLFLDLNPTPESKTATLEALLANIKEHGDKLATGFLGTAILLDTLTKCGRTDIAYTLLLQHGYPSWLYSVDQGATTMWERWNSYTLDKGFGNAGMNSFNHYAYGAVLEWMFATMAGIRYNSAEPGYRSFVLSPHPDPRLQKVDAAYRSPYGRIVSNWRCLDENGWSYYAEIPANSEAIVLLPCPKGEKVTINGKQPSSVTLETDGLSYLGIQGGCAAFKAVATRFTANIR